MTIDRDELLTQLQKVFPEAPIAYMNRPGEPEREHDFQIGEPYNGVLTIPRDAWEQLQTTAAIALLDLEDVRAALREGKRVVLHHGDA